MMTSNGALVLQGFKGWLHASPDSCFLISILYIRVYGSTYTVVYNDTDRVEVSFARQYDPSTAAGVPLNIDKRSLTCPILLLKFHRMLQRSLLVPILQGVQASEP